MTGPDKEHDMAYDIQPRASHYVAGEYIDDAAGAEIPVIYAATGERVATLHAATPAIVERALAAAETAQAEWATWSPRERGRVLTRAAQIMRRIQTCIGGAPKSLSNAGEQQFLSIRRA